MGDVLPQSEMSQDKKIIIVAGPNGAGKTTFATEFLPKEANCPVFVNADLIAAGLNPFRSTTVSIQAGKLMLKQIHEHVSRGESFAFETTLSGRGYARWIPYWREQGYCVKLFFLRLPTADLAVRRVAKRVAEGGHDIPEPVIRRRYDVGWRNFEKFYRHLVDVWALYDNSEEVPKLIDEGQK